MKPTSIALVTFAALAACGPSTRDRGADGDGDNDQLEIDASLDGECVPTTEVCGNGYDDDCDNGVDCEDNECSGVGSCPVCGEVENPIANPLVLPDGEPSTDIACSVDADCAGSPGTECVARLCRIPYRSTLNFIGFADGATLDDTSKFINICATMEHSWIRDLQIDLIPPNGAPIILHDFAGRSGGQIDFGYPNDADNGVPGTGAEYCWTAAAPQTMIQTGNATNPSLMPPGDYKPVTTFSAMQGTPLNGPWTLRITDLWRADDGFLFEWTIAFDASLVTDCSGPIVGRVQN